MKLSYHKNKIFDSTKLNRKMKTLWRMVKHMIDVFKVRVKA